MWMPMQNSNSSYTLCLITPFNFFFFFFFEKNVVVVTWMQYLGEKMEKLTNARDGKELLVTKEHRRGQPFKLARLD